MSEAFLRAFHAAHPGCTRRALARAGSYELLRSEGRVLDLGCGNFPLGLGVDLSREELAASPRGSIVVQARGQALPFRDASFDAVVSHLALMLMPLDDTLAELRRVLVPGGVVRALLGGGPCAHDAFEAFIAMLPPRPELRLTDPRLRSSAGIAAAFAGFTDVTQTDHHLDLSGSFDDVWAFLGASYQLAPAEAPGIEARLRERFGEEVPCKVHVRMVEAIRR